jgi:hypothetical protein
MSSSYSDTPRIPTRGDMVLSNMQFAEMTAETPIRLGRLCKRQEPREIVSDFARSGYNIASRSTVTRTASCWTGHNPFHEPTWGVWPTWVQGSQIWIKGCNYHQFKELKQNQQCFICREAGHRFKDCPNLASKFKSQDFCYFKKTE